jgi:hypothetical protein
MPGLQGGPRTACFALVIDTFSLPGKGIDLKSSIGMHACTRKRETGHEKRLNRVCIKKPRASDHISYTRPFLQTAAFTALDHELRFLQY